MCFNLYKIKFWEIAGIVLGFVLSYLVPVIMQIILYRDNLQDITTWAMVIVGSGVLWQVTTVLSIALYSYCSRCYMTLKEINKKAIIITLVLIISSSIVWVAGLFNTNVVQKIFYFIISLALLILSTGCVFVYRIIAVRAKSGYRGRRRTKNSWLLK